MKTLAVLVAPLLALVVYQHVRERQKEARFGAIASVIAKRDVSVDCPSFFGRMVDMVDLRGARGAVQFDAHGRPADSTSLSDSTCGALERFRRSHAGEEFACLAGNPPPCTRHVAEAAAAVLTLAHESYHLAGERNEGVTECYALQATAFTAERLGASPELAHAVARFDAVYVSPSKPPEYQSSECHDGGRLDLRPASTEWP